ncbi:protein required for normal CLN1 and CLN2 G1 cyclin expression, partial [Coemansia sp. 'formosensis']
KHALARYGLGQMQLQRSDMSSAEATLQRVLDHHPRCVEALRALGYLHARLPNTKAKALEYYEREMQVLADDAQDDAKRQGSDAAAWFTDANLFLEAGLLYEASSAKRARKAYAMAADILQRQGGALGAIPELWNNLGVLSHITGDDDAAIFAEYDEAAKMCTAALAAARARPSDTRKGASKAEVQRLEATLATITYNVARFYEHCGLWANAEALYTGLLAGLPTYVDARLRLAHISFFFHADAAQALAHISQAVAADAKRPAAWLMRGNIELHRKHVQDARRAFEHVLRDLAKHDVYALCSLGNYHLAAGRSESARAAEAPVPAAAKKAKDMAAQSYKRALEFFDKCLQLDDRCAAAAHGTAIAMAERGDAGDARLVFQDVRDAATAGLGPPALTSPASDLVFKIAKHAATTDAVAPVVSVGCDVLLWSGINVAHSYVDVGNYRQAVLAYEASLRRLQDSTRAMEAADATPAGGSPYIIRALGTGDEESGVTATRLTKAERAERSRVERDLRLYLVRALYIQAKAAKDIDIMRTALGHIQSLCADEDITLPESALKPTADTEADTEAATEAKDTDAKDTDAKDTDAKDAADSDVEMAEDVAESAAESESDKKKKKKPRLSPDDCLILFDLALVEQSVAHLVSDQPESQRTLSDLSQAADSVAHSLAAFTFLAAWGKAMQKKRQKLLFSARLATERADYSRSLVSKLARKLQEQETFERQRQEHVEQWHRQQEEDEKKKREDAERAAQTQEELERKLLRDAEERNAILREQMAAASAKDDAAAESSGRAKKSRARADGFISDNDDMASDAGSDGEGRRKSKKLKQVRKPAEPRSRVRAKPSGGHTDDNDTDVSVARKRLNITKNDDDEDGDGEEQPPTPTEPSRYKSKAIVTDSDDDDDSNV